MEENLRVCAYGLTDSILSLSSNKVPNIFVFVFEFKLKSWDAIWSPGSILMNHFEDLNFSFRANNGCDQQWLDSFIRKMFSIVIRIVKRKGVAFYSSVYDNRNTHKPTSLNFGSMLYCGSLFLKNFSCVLLILTFIETYYLYFL